MRSGPSPRGSGWSRRCVSGTACRWRARRITGPSAAGRGLRAPSRREPELALRLLESISAAGRWRDLRPLLLRLVHTPAQAVEQRPVTGGVRALQVGEPVEQTVDVVERRPRTPGPAVVLDGRVD